MAVDQLFGHIKDDQLLYRNVKNVRVKFIMKGDAMENQLMVIQNKISPIIDLSESLMVVNNQSLDIAKGEIRGIKTLREEIISVFGPMKEKAFQTHKEICAKEKQFLDPLDTTEGIIKKKIAEYLDDCERTRRAEEQRLREQAEKEKAKRLEKINQKISSLMEKGQSVQEKIDELIIALGSCENEEEASMMRSSIAGLESQLNAVQSQIIIQEQKAEFEAQPEIINVASAPKVSGMSARKIPEPEVIDCMALVRAIADGRAPKTIIKWDMSAIKKLVGAGMELPGVRVTMVTNILVKKGEPEK